MTSDLRKVRIKVLPDTFNAIRVDTERWSRIVTDSSLSPRMSAPFMIFRSENEFLLILDDADAMGLKAMFPDIEFDSGLRLLEIRSDEGLRDPRTFARLSQLVADGGYGIRCISAWDADFAVLQQDELGTVLKLLSPEIEELC
jgi:hypothetical protein